MAGTGKSTIARTVAHEYYYKRKRLGASFFFSRGGGDVGHAGKFFTTIALQLAKNIPALRDYICEAITEHSDIENQSLRDQWRQLVLGPLLKLDANSRKLSYALVVDALDECEDKNHIQIILQLLVEARSLQMTRLRIIITSRPEIPIRHGLYQLPDAAHKDFVLHRTATIDHDITIFLEHEFGLIRQERVLDASWPGQEVIERLVENANGLFIWAATASGFIRKGKQFSVRRLDRILEDSSTFISVTAPEERLDEIYITVLKNSISPDLTDEENKELYAVLNRVLGSIVVLLSPLSADSISRLLHVPKEDVDQMLEDLHAILDIPKDQTLPLRLLHPSFRDFLLNKDRCGDPNFHVDKKQAHRTLTDSCIRRMTIALKQDICDQRAPGVLATDVKSTRVEQCLPREVQYACLYWVQHLQRSDEQLHDDGQVHQFLQAHLLYWLEALSWMRRTSEGIIAITSLESITIVSHSAVYRKII
jgi:hypothetical protein